MSSKTPEATYEQIADYFIALANDTGSLITNLKLQKLVYYAQAWQLAMNGTPLFNEDFEAWVHGPVLRELYNQYRTLGWKPIIKEVAIEEVKAKLSESVNGLLKEVCDVYFELDAYKLEKLTHQEEPWIEARAGLPENEVCCNEISKTTMQRYYSSLMEA